LPLPVDLHRDCTIGTSFAIERDLEVRGVDGSGCYKSRLAGFPEYVGYARSGT
jgi:hypothetical protein